VIVFLDASALIYLIEGNEPFASRARGELARLARKHGNLEIAISRLAWLECRVRPARENDLHTMADYDAFFGRPDLQWVELTRDVIELATAIRAKHGLRTPEALHAASCIHMGQNHVFLTGDAVFRKVGGLTVRLLT
jgi:predicted nucleic acid-binding protein